MEKKTEVFIAPTIERACIHIVDCFVLEMEGKERVNLGTATGSTMIPVYREVCSRVAEGELSLQNVYAYQLDEYYPIEPWNEQSYKFFLWKHLVNPTDMPKENLHVLNGLSRNPEETAARWDKILKDVGRIDFQIAGIGVKGHIAFMESNPQGGQKLRGSKTQLVDLDQSTIEANKRFFKEGEVQPTQALTVGLGTLLPIVRHWCLAAFGLKKSQAIATTLFDPIGDRCPASYIREGQRATVVVDKEAALDFLFRVQKEGLPDYLTVECL